MIERIKCGMNNCYLLSQGDNTILVDTGTKADRKKILRACRGRNVRLIALTHGHCDHAGNAARLSRELGAPIAMHPADLPLLRDTLAEPLQSPGWTGKIMIRFIRLTKSRVSRSEPFDIAVELREGLTLAEYGVDARIIELPGHTRGSVGVVTGDGLIAGDALTNLFPPAGKAALWSDEAAMEASAAKAGALGDVMVWFGHGGPARNRAW
ncbi:MAG: MBL fold metallo-hydrolase [Firmicutes bacterium]|nr:MBL fold metallo-hydrolase [Bacillota bacterium]